MHHPQDNVNFAHRWNISQSTDCMVSGCLFEGIYGFWLCWKCCRYLLFWLCHFSPTEAHSLNKHPNYSYLNDCDFPECRQPYLIQHSVCKNIQIFLFVSVCVYCRFMFTPAWVCITDCHDWQLLVLLYLCFIISCIKILLIHFGYMYIIKLFC